MTTSPRLPAPRCGAGGDVRRAKGSGSSGRLRVFGRSYALSGPSSLVGQVGRGVGPGWAAG